MNTTIDSKKLRNVAGAFATGITVVTTEREDGSIHGMTANSFLSVSLNPPLVAFSVKETGSMAKYLKVGKKVGISILADDQEVVSNQFAGWNDPPVAIEMDVHHNGVQTVKNCLAWYCTEIAQIIPAGDHHLVLCSVTDLNRSEKGKPLLYFAGYKSVAF